MKTTMDDLVKRLGEVADHIDRHLPKDCEEEVIDCVRGTLHGLAAVVGRYRNGEKESLHILGTAVQGALEDLGKEVIHAEEIERFKRLIEEIDAI